MFKYDFVAYSPLSLPVKEFRKLGKFGEVVGKSLVSFFDSRCSTMADFMFSYNLSVCNADGCS